MDFSLVDILYVVLSLIAEIESCCGKCQLKRDQKYLIMIRADESRQV